MIFSILSDSPYITYYMENLKVTNHGFSHGANMRDVPLENYIHKLKFTKITTYRGYNTKYLHGEKS